MITNIFLLIASIRMIDIAITRIRRLQVPLHRAVAIAALARRRPAGGDEGEGLMETPLYPIRSRLFLAFSFLLWVYDKRD